MHFSGSGHILREAWGTSHWSRHSRLSSLHGLFQALLQGTMFYVQQWLKGQWHKQHGLHGPSTPHQSPSLFHGQHPQPSVTECIWPIYQPAHKWLSGLASLKLLEPLRNKCSGYIAHSSAVHFFHHASLFLIWATFTASYSSYIKIFSCLHFRSWSTLDFF